MKTNISRQLYRGVASVLVVFSLYACSTSSDEFPQIANPPPFDFVDGEELRSNMHRLAFELQKLDMSLSDNYDDQPSFQREIVESIRNIERIGGFVRETDLSVRHPFLVDDMDRFLADVSRAREEADRNTPRYYMAGRISGACVSCHRENR